MWDDFIPESRLCEVREYNILKLISPPQGNSYEIFIQRSGQ